MTQKYKPILLLTFDSPKTGREWCNVLKLNPNYSDNTRSVLLKESLQNFLKTNNLTIGYPSVPTFQKEFFIGADPSQEDVIKQLAQEHNLTYKLSACISGDSVISWLLD